jgi:hypothetical protein
VSAEHVAKSLDALGQREEFADRILAKFLLGDINDGFTRRNILQRRWPRLSSLYGVEAGLSFLVNRGTLRRIEMKTGGRPKTIYRFEP